MKLSIVVPVYNAQKYLIECLDSIKNQILTDWECILIDDGSTDKSGAICDTYSVSDKRFKVIHKYNSGPSDCRNLGIYLAKGDWLGFVDADDWIMPDRFSVAIKKAEEQNVKIAQCSINVFQNGKITKHWHLGKPGIYTIQDGRILSDPLYDIGHCWDKIYKMKFIRDNNISFYNCNMAEDTLFNIEAYCRAGHILSIGDTLYNYRLIPETLSHSSIDGKRKLSILKETKNLFERLSIDPNFNRIRALVASFMEKIILRSDSIDYIFPYVNCNTQAWKNTYSRFRDLTKEDEIRFRSNDLLLKYKFRAIERWMPWVGVIHFIVSDESQIPDWLDVSKVNIVYHTEIIPEKYLPTFNSCTIEMFLHNIYGLSEKFIYSNDDVFPNYVLKPKFYFEDDKLKSNFFFRKLWHEGDINLPWARIINNSTKLAANDTPFFLDKYVSNTDLYELQHIGKPMFRSINKKVWQLYKEEIESSITRFRDGKNFNQGIFTSYALFHNRGIFATFKFRYYQIGRNTKEIINTILEKDDTKRVRSICCNDTEVTTDDDVKSIINAFNTIYPNKSKFENK